MKISQRAATRRIAAVLTHRPHAPRSPLAASPRQATPAPAAATSPSSVPERRIREQFRDSLAAAAVSVVGAGAIALLLHLAGSLAN